MPRIYLSPSTQEFNPYITTGNEEYWMNLIADAMIPYLQQYGIEYGRNRPGMTAGSSIRESNAGNYDFHLAIHSNASGQGQAGNQRGTVIFYYPTSTNGLRMAELISEQFKKIYPNPERVRIEPTTNLGEVSRTSAPSVLIEVAYHDNVEDANWITNNIDTIAKAIADAVNQYFTSSSSGTASGQTGRVNIISGYLNIRSGPSLNSPVTGMAPNGATLRILGSSGDWYNIEYNGQNGYVSSNYVVLQ